MESDNENVLAEAELDKMPEYYNVPAGIGYNARLKYVFTKSNAPKVSEIIFANAELVQSSPSILYGIKYNFKEKYNEIPLVIGQLYNAGQMVLITAGATGSNLMTVTQYGLNISASQGAFALLIVYELSV